jgi:hypothetical protein
MSHGASDRVRSDSNYASEMAAGVGVCLLGPSMVQSSSRQKRQAGAVFTAIDYNNCRDIGGEASVLSVY